MINGPAIPAVNLDAAAAMPMYPGFPQRYAEYLRQYEVNPHGVTCFAARCRQALENAAERLMLAAGAPPGRYHVIWCSSATEAVNIGLHSLCVQQRPQKVLYDAGGHPALRHTAAAAAPGRTVCTLHTPQGTMLIPEDAAQCTLAALSLVNSENGAVWHGDKSPLPRECRLLLDASQGFGLHPVPWHSAAPDMVVFSAHKMGAAGNTAALMCRRDIQLTPLFSGGGQQNGIRPGTIHLPGCLLMADAAEKAASARQQELQRLQELNTLLREGITRLGKGKWRIFSPEDASPAILFFAIPGYEGALVARILAEKYNILVGTGSACSAESRETSSLLRAMGVQEALSRCAIRISLHHSSTPADIETFLHALPPLLQDF